MKTPKNTNGRTRHARNIKIKNKYITQWLKENKQELLERNRELYKMAKLGIRGKKQGAKLVFKGLSL